jgi:aryl-alcohol dehydrogenase-like predicted oxidoreductase
MLCRKLGNTGIEVSEIGFGAWGIGGDSYGKVNDEVSIKALKKAYESGINFYDTSDIYGSGHSEELIGKVFKGKRDKIVIATKGGTLPHFNLPMPQDFSPKHLRIALEESLKRLKTDYVDLYQLHSPPIDEIVYSDVKYVLESFRKEGMIRAIGVSVKSPYDILVAIKEVGAEVIQANFNMIDHRILENDLLYKMKSWGIGFIARTPLCFGFLTGALSANTKFESNDHRGNWDKKQIKIWADAPKAFDFLKIKGQTYAQLALRFCLSYPIATVIPGMMSPEEVGENIKASEFGGLDGMRLRTISDIYKDNEFYVGR